MINDTHESIQSISLPQFVVPQSFCQGNLALGLLQKLAKYRATTNDPARVAHKFGPAKPAFQGRTKPPLPDARPKRNKATTTLTNPQTTFNTGPDTRLKGVMWVCPVIPLTMWGIAFQPANPAKKYHSNSIFSPPSL